MTRHSDPCTTGCQRSYKGVGHKLINYASEGAEAISCSSVRPNQNPDPDSDPVGSSDTTCMHGSTARRMRACGQVLQHGALVGRQLRRRRRRGAHLEAAPRRPPRGADTADCHQAAARAAHDHARRLRLILHISSRQDALAGPIGSRHLVTTTSCRRSVRSLLEPLGTSYEVFD